MYVDDLHVLSQSDAPSLNADPESKMGRLMPEWLTTLILKHQGTLTAPASTTASSAPSKAAATSVTAEAPVLPAPHAGLTAAVATPVPAADSSAEVKAVRSSKVKVGELSVFLSGCMTGMHACSESENEALSIVSEP